MRWAVAIAVAVLAAAIASYMKLPLQLGAHPVWADKVVFRGALIGIVLVIASSRLQYAARAVGLAVLTGIAYGIAHIGKTRFAASYAEDAFAGQIWFLGWHGVCAFAVATVAT